MFWQPIQRLTAHSPTVFRSKYKIVPFVRIQFFSKRFPPKLFPDDSNLSLRFHSMLRFFPLHINIFQNPISKLNRFSFLQTRFEGNFFQISCTLNPRRLAILNDERKQKTRNTIAGKITENFDSEIGKWTLFGWRDGKSQQWMESQTEVIIN